MLTTSKRTILLSTISIQNQNWLYHPYLNKSQKQKIKKTKSYIKKKKKKKNKKKHKKNIDLKKYPKNNNKNSSEKKLENIPTKQLMINKIDDKQKIRSTDIQPTLDSYQNQRRVNKGKIR